MAFSDRGLQAISNKLTRSKREKVKLGRVNLLGLSKATAELIVEDIPLTGMNSNYSKCVKKVLKCMVLVIKVGLEDFSTLIENPQVRKNYLKTGVGEEKKT